MHRFFITAVLSCVLPSTGLARLGETVSECERRYGGSLAGEEGRRVAQYNKLLAGLQEREFRYDGFQVRIAYDDSTQPVLSIRYINEASRRLTDEQIAAILNANSNGQEWKRDDSKFRMPGTGAAPTLFQNLTMGMIMKTGAWVRSDGALAYVGPMRGYLVIDSPEALEIREAAITGEKAKREVVPKF